MDFIDYIDEFVTDGKLDGRAASTVEMYALHLGKLHATTHGDVTLRSVKHWLGTASSAESARVRGRSVRAFGRWADKNDGPDWEWWPKVPLSSVAITPQLTVKRSDYEATRSKAGSVRDRLVIELLWCTGLRVPELARVNFDDVSLLSKRFATACPRRV